jgi:hypothetical protein
MDIIPERRHTAGPWPWERGAPAVHPPRCASPAPTDRSCRASAATAAIAPGASRPSPGRPPTSARETTRTTPAVSRPGRDSVRWNGGPPAS